MNQFPSPQRQLIVDRIPMWALIGAWFVCLCLAAACLYWTIFGNGPDAPSGVDATQVAQQASPTPASETPLPPATAPDPNLVTLPPPTAPASGQPNQPEAVKTPTLTPLLDPTFGYGVQLNGLVGRPPDACDLAGRVGATWIKQQMRWGDFGHGPSDAEIDWSGFDWVIRACNKRDLKIMLSIVTAPSWSRGWAVENTHGPPDDLNAYATFLGMVVDRYKGQIHAIEIWNEQNLSREWATSPQQLSASRYVEMLKLAYNAIKSRDPGIIVISGALSPTGVDDGINAIDDFRYLQEMADAGMLDYADCVGVHHNGYNVGPDVAAQTAMQHPEAATAHFKGPFSSFNGGLPHHSWFFYDTLQTYARIVGGRKPLCITEFGWATSEGYPGTPPGFEFALDNTLKEQADYIVQAYTLMRQWGFVKLAFLWNLDYGNKGNGYQDDVVPYSLIDVNGMPRPAFEALQNMPKP